MRALWDDPDLWFSQCCGFDLVARYRGQLRPLATPRHAAPGCRGRDYASVVLVAEDRAGADIADLAGTRCVVNGPESHSGMNALRALVAPHSHGGRFFASVVESGAHADSIAMVARGQADVCSIDCVTHALLARHRPAALAGTRRFAISGPAPGIPYVTRVETGADEVARMRAALLRSFGQPDLAAAREALLLDGIELTELEDYSRISEIGEAADALGYRALA